ncbi:bifunctional proline dehydrogenase/L-glutamate gamma-semialdehyde dehydrogenase PutA [Siculibacillus lacustris]|uniref:Bifunctional protein PutA n=1 Tax=Siculibacillus lacustris TaxID=1549641 RepID=A0A4Q9VVJ0_9HYPH|nr:bifunctional proline dehydrogenase/L-glutamate gamma-semialdehyde dehydrogenase PutA [Siculibacillus lacustris]TBW39218.1 bifunctional proline dehydrogenase/L-glutamate gamma-semialdehyde dehydrogenase PutA [Siculibacillus lacustris]
MTASRALVPQPPTIAPFRAAYAPDDVALVRALIVEARFDPAADARIDAHATRLIDKIRAETGSFGVEEFLREYSLTTREGLALMVLAEALLRVPDSETADKLIEDKLAEAEFENHERVSDAWLVSASAWAMGLTARIFRPGETPLGVISGMVKRLGRPTIRTAARQAMRVMGYQFVLGETIDSALSRAASWEAKGYRYSYDMLGEGARTAADADKYFADYALAIERIGKGAAGKAGLPSRAGISVKLSALHPRYEAVNGEAVMRELVPRLLDLARAAKAHDLAFTVDAEEADRLELSLDVFAATLADPSLKGWDGFGLAVQAYQKRAVEVVDWIGALAEAHDRRLMVRLVKGAYWDTEIKRAQERGLVDYPLFTRKAATDLSYLACARKLLRLRPRIYPQFAGHNAVTVAQVREIAREGWSDTDPGFEYQKLHGMGDALHRGVVEDDGMACRIYAPVGGHRDLLAYLVRRLLENGANSSFVAKVGDTNIPVSALLTRPAEELGHGARARHARIPVPAALYGDARRNSGGLELGWTADRETLERKVAAAVATPRDAAPVIDGTARPGTARAVVSPVDGTTVVGRVVEADAALAGDAITRAVAAQADWDRTPAATRAEALERAADALEAERESLMALLASEAGKTLPDGLAEVREAADFCRYYAAEARRLFGEDRILPGPTGEENRLHHRGRGAFVCISPWNFPLAIFVGQITAALAAGNTVIAKPAEQTPLIAARAVALLHAAGIPAGALHLVPGDGTVGAALVADPRIAGVAFTGSTETARRINRTLAAKDGPIVPLIAETGGINAMIVDATALPEQVADDVVLSAFRSAGQRCSALRLLFLQEDVADRVLEMIVGAAATLRLGDPRLLATDLGPVIDAEAKARLDDHLAACRAAGRIVWEGSVPDGALAAGTWVAPTVVRLDRAADLTTEVFGPVLHVVRWKADELDAVIASIVGSGYGLTLGLHSRIDATVRRVCDAVSVGNVYVNRNMIGAVVGVQPFGGSGLSGTGPKAGGPSYLPRFALEQVISTNTAAAGGNTTLIAMGEE